MSRRTLPDPVAGGQSDRTTLMEDSRIAPATTPWAGPGSGRKGVLSFPSARVLQQPLLLTAPIALGRGFALVVVFFPLGDPDLHLRDALVVEVQNQRNKRHALALCFVPKFRQFLARHQELAPAPFLVREHGAVVGCDIGIDEPQLPDSNGGITFGDIGAVLAQRFHLRAL